MERGLSANTLAAYRRDLDRYAAWLTDMGVSTVREVTSKEVEQYIAWLSTGDAEHAKLSASSVSRAKSAIGGLHRFAATEGRSDSDPSAQVPTPKAALRLPKAIDVDDVHRLLEAATVRQGFHGRRDLALLEFLYGTGARVSEAIGADVDDVDLDQASVRLRGKGNKVRTVPLGRYASEALGSYLVRARPSKTPAHSKLFVNARGGPLTRQGAHLILLNVADVAGLPRGIGPHTLRHSFATHLLDGGADVRVVQELLGHSAVSTTQIYTLVTVDKLREVYATSHPRAR